MLPIAKLSTRLRPVNIVPLPEICIRNVIHVVANLALDLVTEGGQASPRFIRLASQVGSLSLVLSQAS